VGSQLALNYIHQMNRVNSRDARPGIRQQYKYRPLIIIIIITTTSLRSLQTSIGCDYRQRIQYKLCILVYQWVQGSALSYLRNAICPVVSVESRRRLRSASSADLIVLAMRRTTMGDRAFAVTALRTWNSLPDGIHRSPSLAVFKRLLKTHFYI